MPKWLDNAVFYEIYPQTFNDTNADGIGDIEGIIEKLAFIKDLGCNAIWINPCFESPFKDAGYDISDYYKVAPRYGTNSDLRRLFEEAHKKDMRVILDLVPGHTSTDHKWFLESMKPEKNEYTDRYVWTDRVWNRPNEMPGLTNNGCLIGISDRDGAVLTNYYSSQAALNFGFYNIDDPKWQQPMDAPGPKATFNEMMNIMRFWFKMGCDGFRVDMAFSLVKNDPDREGTIKLWQQCREILDKEFPDKALVAEWGEPENSLRGGFHMDFMLPFGSSHYSDLFRCENPYFTKKGGDISEFIKAYESAYEKSGGGLMCIPSGNHDIERIAKYLDNEEMKIAYAFIYSMPGAPYLYAGDEIGMRYIEGLRSKEGGYERTGTRTPIQWNDGLNAGFSDAPEYMLYTPIDPDENRPTIEAALADENSILNEVKRLISIRKEHIALQSNAKITFLTKEGYPLVYLREAEEESVLVLINPSDKKVYFKTDLIGEKIYENGSVSFENGKYIIDSASAAFIKIK